MTDRIACTRESELSFNKTFRSLLNTGAVNTVGQNWIDKWENYLNQNNCTENDTEPIDVIFPDRIKIRNILIFGICGTGKTIFSRMIQREFKSYQTIEVNTIISALQKVMSEIPIGFIHDDIKENRLPEFLNLLIQNNIKKNGEESGFIVNGDSILPEDIIKFFDLKDMMVYYFVSEKSSPKDLLENCRKLDTEEEWITEKSDEELLKHFVFYKDMEKKIINDCKKYGIRCIDTSESKDIISLSEQLLDELKTEFNV